MPRYIDTHGHTKVAIGICARCSLKFPYDELVQDPNFPGLYVCQDDLDQFDPYRLPARATEDITLDHARPDVGIYGAGPSPILPASPIIANLPSPYSTTVVITQIAPVAPWQPNTPYLKSASVTPKNIDDPAVDLPQNWFICLIPGTSGSSQPAWPTKAGVFIADNGVVWLCYGIYTN